MEERTLGDYRLIRVLAEHDTRTTWLAEQLSVGRSAVVVELNDLAHREAFLADARTKASVDHPLIGSVYEAVSQDDACYVALERLPGNTLAERLGVSEQLAPAEVVHLLRRVAEAMIYFESRDLATEPLTPDSIHLDAHGVVRLKNLIREGRPDPVARQEEMKSFGAALPALVADGKAGSTRLITVLSWMRGEGLDHPLSWDQVLQYAEQIEAQLSEPRPAGGPATRELPSRRLPLAGILAGVGVSALAIAAALVFLPRDPAPPPPPPPELPPLVAIPAGEHPTPDGARTTLAAFSIGGGEVTIGEYKQFLDTLELLEPSRRGVFDAEGQPESKTGHEPDGWQEMLAAAEAGGTWEGRKVDLFCPVVNVDWWDARAYCRWRKGRLPSQEEWFAALRTEVQRPEFLKPAAWGPVSAIPMGDRTPNGLRGMAGSVSEWTLTPAVNPANPLGAKRHVIIGASFLKPSNGALAREWTDDLLQRRPDLGFRMVEGLAE